MALPKLSSDRRTRESIEERVASEAPKVVGRESRPGGNVEGQNSFSAFEQPNLRDVSEQIHPWDCSGQEGRDGREGQSVMLWR